MSMLHLYCKYTYYIYIHIINKYIYIYAPTYAYVYIYNVNVGLSSAIESTGIFIFKHTGMRSHKTKNTVYIHIYRSRVYLKHSQTIYLSSLFGGPSRILFPLAMWDRDPGIHFGMVTSQMDRNLANISGWWFQPIWKMLVKMGIFPK